MWMDGGWHGMAFFLVCFGPWICEAGGEEGNCWLNRLHKEEDPDRDGYTLLRNSEMIRSRSLPSSYYSHLDLLLNHTLTHTHSLS